MKSTDGPVRDECTVDPLSGRELLLIVLMSVAFNGLLLLVRAML